MSDQPTDRQALYDRIRRSSKEEVIREEMVRLGFWPARGSGADDLATELDKRGELQRELRDLRQQQSRLHDEEAVLKQIRKRRIMEARAKREQTKLRMEQERQERKESWALEKTRSIGFVGEGYSAGLNERECDAAKLGAHGLPDLGDAAAIATAMAIDVGALRFLAFARTTSETSHYVRFTIPKKAGGERLISAPMPRLKAAQRWILDNVLSKVSLHDAAHGFVQQRSIVTNATPHVGAKVVINLDLSDFFATVSYKRVRGQFRALGYSQAAATIFALICTEPDIETVELDGRTWHVALGDRHLPQGAPTSPALTNIICRRLDRKLSTLAERMRFRYTRYADDLTFSSAVDDTDAVGKLLRRTRHLIRTEGFVVHPAKTRVLRRGHRQEVTGVTVNDKLGVDRATLKKFRATLHQIEKDGPDGKRWGDSDDVMAAVIGFANFVFMVDPVKGALLRDRTKQIAKTHGYVPPPPRRKAAAVPATEPEAAPATEPADVAGGGEKKKPWWKLW